MRLVFVHGRAQEGRCANELRAEWEEGLRAGWSKHGITPPTGFTIHVPFYSDRLAEFTRRARTPVSDVVHRGANDVPQTINEFEEAFLQQLVTRAGVTDEEIQAELTSEVIQRGPQNWEWLQAAFRVLSRRSPWLGRKALALIADVETYLTRPNARAEVDRIVRAELTDEHTVVVAHSLGTVVAYAILHSMGITAQVPLLVTLGSPLGIGVVKQYLRPPSLSVPQGVAKWVNGSDERDYVALFSRLDRDTFAAGIENITDIHNREDDPHSIAEYLQDRMIAERVAVALR